MKKFFLLLLVPTLSFAQIAEIHECDGKWTNLPCDKVNTPMNSRKVLSPEQAKARSQKESILHRLRMNSIEASRKYEIEFDISGAEDRCNNIDTSVEVCRREVERLDEKLDKKINAAALLKQREEKIKQTDATQVPNQTTVIIGDRYPYYRRHGRRYQSDQSGYGAKVIINGGPQIEQNVIIKQPSVPIVPPAPPPTPQSSGSHMR